MTFSHIPLLILAGLMGINSQITTVSKVSVQAGGSISIACLYQPVYRDNVKYLCEGKYWISCKYAVKTNKPDDSGKFSISDDKNQSVFTVTINDLKDNGQSYWCAVEIDNRLDKGHHLLLSVTNGKPLLYVDQQEVAAVEGGSVTVICHYGKHKVTWCRLGGTCVSDQTGSIDGTTVTINASVPNVYNVTMSQLRTESSGWYWCTSNGFQIPVRLAVRELAPTKRTATAMSLSTARLAPVTTQHPLLASATESHTAQSTSSSTNNTGGETTQEESKISTKMIILIATLSALLLLALAVCFGCWMIRRSKTKPEVPDITAGSQTESDPVHYSAIVHKQRAAAAKKKTELADEIVIYSTLATHSKK